MRKNQRLSHGRAVNIVDATFLSLRNASTIMAKISKKDQDLTREEEEANRNWFDSLPKSQHFTVGTDIIWQNQRGTIEAVVHCKCPLSETGLKVRWEDGSLEIIKPIALNRNGLHHG